MSAWTEEQPMRVAFAAICEGETPWVALGNFSNDFFPNEDRREALIKDPIEEPQGVSVELHRWAVFCAASVEYLCHKYDLTVPDWVYSYPPLEDQWFHSHAESNPVRRERYLRTTPPEFALRNIYCGDRIWQDKHEEAAKLQQRLLSA
ncbi:hypothetical protein [Dictyobacter arantiisoli]|uniref:Uncharacterized protein n=1 Tax=Dictyobacter arantiisoli TaxID=2014874 RepID=A0A5A5TIG2_9CHLR|nr:hypothetical protein [Dictyobacter arantiisoli]GCF10906.1 hypothetical protein KDI_44700 [Dictyobacter arantiisoli]